MLEENVVHHGDCRDLILKCRDNKPAGIITDFPYGIDFQSNMRKSSPKFNKILNDKKPFVNRWISNSYLILPPNSFLLTFYRWDIQDILFEELEVSGFEVKNQIIWLKSDKPGLGDLEGSFGECHECAAFAVKGRYNFPSHAGRPKNIYKCDPVPTGQMVHPNEKPINLMRALIRDLTSPGDLILEPFSGSCAVGAAAVMEGRRVIAMELDDRMVPHIGMNYIDFGNKRIRDNLKKSSSVLF